MKNTFFKVAYTHCNSRSCRNESPKQAPPLQGCLCSVPGSMLLTTGPGRRWEQVLALLEAPWGVPTDDPKKEVETYLTF